MLVVATPSPTAAAARLPDPWRASPAAKWSVIKSPVEVPVRCAGYGEPLSQEQIARPAKAQRAK
jgi:hypothetical protein